MTEKQKAEAYVREKLPELMELSFGCEYLSYSINGVPSGYDYKEEIINGNKHYLSKRVHTFNGTENSYLTERIKEGKTHEIIGHPIQLSDWLRVLMNCTNTSASVHGNHIRVVAGDSIVDIGYDTGQPATEADYKAFNDIVGI